MALVQSHQDQLLAILSRSNPDPSSTSNYLLTLFEIIDNVPEIDEQERALLNFMESNRDQIRGLDISSKAKLLVFAISSRNSIWFQWLLNKSGGNADPRMDLPVTINMYYQSLLGTRDNPSQRYKLEDVLDYEFTKRRVGTSSEIIENFEAILEDSRRQWLVPFEDVRELLPFIARVRQEGITGTGRAVSQPRTVLDALKEAR